MGAIETLAIILIVISVIKLLTILISPKTWTNFVKKIYVNKTAAIVVYSVLAAVVLYYLLGAGITIVQILAVTVFVSLLLGIGFVKYMDHLLKLFPKNYSLKDQWFYVLIWVILLLWGIKELFF
jgi:hypothetical protein